MYIIVSAFGHIYICIYICMYIYIYRHPKMGIPQIIPKSRNALVTW